MSADSDFFDERADVNVTTNGLQVVSVGISPSVGTGTETLVGIEHIALVGGHREDSAAGTDSLTGGTGDDTFDNDPADNDSRVTDVSDSVIANVFAAPFPSWLILI